MAKVLVIGSGGREQALAWKLAQSPAVDTVYVAPGNGGSAGKIENVAVAFDDVNGLLRCAKEKGIDLALVGQETASEAGVVDAFQSEGIDIFGPTQKAVTIETSKAFSKDLMRAQHIPTAEYRYFTDPDAAREYAKSRPFPVVIKADGLATGKGVIIADKERTIDEAIDSIMVKKIFGSSGNTVVVEDFLKGRELSMHALSDGKTSVLFPPTQDHKQVFDGDNGPNTGGMGVYGPVDWVSPKMLKDIKAQVVTPALEGLAAQDALFAGCLYPGLMIDSQEIKVLEFNARFGDPEAQVYMRLLDSDLYDILKACVHGELRPEMVRWKTGHAVCVILASPGYPGEYPKGLPITGVKEAEDQDDIVIFHAGTALDASGQLVTAGGRVLNVTAVGQTLEDALAKVYTAVKSIHFEGMHYRKDIGRRA